MSEPTLDIVKTKIRKIFPSKGENEILSQLQSYGTESYEREKYRVYLAILKLCEENGLTNLEHYIGAAKQDYRDVLYWAEYPNDAKSATWNEKDPEEIERIRKLDQEQYNKWLNKT
jgi:hypothetical protein